MSSTGPIVGSFHIAQAYGLKPMPPTRRAPNSSTSIPQSAPAASPKPGARLVAAPVPGRVNFSGAAPAPDASSFAMYAHPADKNAAATAVSAGRLIDVTA
jgi:hypothetical protein